MEPSNNRDSKTPTSKATIELTSTPTFELSFAPTSESTSEPTSDPTSEPTSKSTSEPTSIPSSVPSSAMSTSPTGANLRQLKASDGVVGDQFGKSVATSNGLLVVGANRNDEKGSDSGSVYVFDSSTREELHKLVASDGAAKDQFGKSVALSNDLVVIGAHGNDFNGKGSGSAYIFNVRTGEELHKLIASDGTAKDQFGTSVAISNDLVAVGAHWDIKHYQSDGYERSGSAYIFNAITGDQLHKLVASDGIASDQFGNSMALSHDLVVVGANKKEVNGFKGAGSVYIFNSTTGKELHKLIPDDLAQRRYFGKSVAISNGLVVVAAIIDVYKPSSGLAYIFDAFTGVKLRTLKTTDGAVGSVSGWSVSISNDLVVVGAVGKDNGNKSQDGGIVYIFNAITGEQLHKLEETDGAIDNSFGRSVAISNDLVVIGDVGDGNKNSGSAYMFKYLR